jgi:hypothetical protein
MGLWAEVFDLTSPGIAMPTRTAELTASMTNAMGSCPL